MPAEATVSTFTRRSLLQASGATALAAPFTGFSTTLSVAQGGPLFRFGVVADPQYAPVQPRRTRFYLHSLWKLSEAVEFFNGQDLQFVVHQDRQVNKGYRQACPLSLDSSWMSQGIGEDHAGSRHISYSSPGG